MYPPVTSIMQIVWSQAKTGDSLMLEVKKFVFESIFLAHPVALSVPV